MHQIYYPASMMQSLSFFSQEHIMIEMIVIKTIIILFFIQLFLTKFASGLVCSAQLIRSHQQLFVGLLYRPEPVPVLPQRFVELSEASGFAVTGLSARWQAG